MCITVNHAKLSKTKILSVPVGNGNHFIAYSNSVKNESGEPKAMVFAVPGKTNQSLFYDTTKYKDFLNEIIKKSRLDEDYYGISYRGLSKSLSFDSFTLGNYTVGLADNFDGILNFINSQPEEKKPKIKEELSEFFKNHYYNMSFVVCLFDSNKTIDAQPIAFEYKPFFSDELYFPTMDSHNGLAPVLNSAVRVDHTFIYEHTGKPDRELNQEFVTLKADVPSFLQNRKFRTITAKGTATNGDVFIDLNNLQEIPFSEDAYLERG